MSARWKRKPHETALDRRRGESHLGACGGDDSPSSPSTASTQPTTLNFSPTVSGYGYAIQDVTAFQSAGQVTATLRWNDSRKDLDLYWTNALCVVEGTALGGRAVKTLRGLSRYRHIGDRQRSSCGGFNRPAICHQLRRSARSYHRGGQLAPMTDRGTSIVQRKWRRNVSGPTKNGRDGRIRTGGPLTPSPGDQAYPARCGAISASGALETPRARPVRSQIPAGSPRESRHALLSTLQRDALATASKHAPASSQSDSPRR